MTGGLDETQQASRMDAGCRMRGAGSAERETVGERRGGRLSRAVTCMA